LKDETIELAKYWIEKAYRTLEVAKYKTKNKKFIKPISLKLKSFKNKNYCLLLIK